ncbi:hypothetical protein G4Y73_03010 [Wenzhouxiangella sp. XN201]|uniref:hypothetical protein n=1 Tax=Wenzhouxiangella sp. XN201 TaxID=2710755 RepID=UPI0013CCB10F|nr:hypothetical protein [Wenzhouxiangella sp. XN201]NEZ03118.1 hypothetical protein [Wenzhouxiangella sp. XN201]
MNNTHGTKKGTRILSALFALLFALGGSAMLTGCEDQGPAEEAGEEIDEAIDDTGDAIEDAGDDIDDETDNG